MATHKQNSGGLSPPGSVSSSTLTNSPVVAENTTSNGNPKQQGPKQSGKRQNRNKQSGQRYDININVGQVGQRKNRSGKSATKSQSEKIEGGVKTFMDTREYIKLKGMTYQNKEQLDRANAWIGVHEATICPQEMNVCIYCDAGAQFKLCDCYIVTPTPETMPADVHAHIRGATNHVEHLGLLRKSVYDFMDWDAPSFDFEIQNNQNLSGFHNRTINDDRIISGLYNFITTNMNVSYHNASGFEDRMLKIEHCRRLAHRYADINNLDLVGDTIMANRFKFTIQRSCDQLENSALYQETTPGQSFWQAWSPQSPEAWRRFLILMCCVTITVAVVIALMFSLVSYILSTLFVSFAVHTILRAIQVYLLNLLQLGSMQPLWFVIGTKITICVLGIVAVTKGVMKMLKRSRPSTRR